MNFDGFSSFPVFPKKAREKEKKMTSGAFVNYFFFH